MRFLTFVSKNLLRRQARTALTAVGLAVALAAVMILSGIAWNFQRSFMTIYRAKGIDLVVVRAGISNQLSSNLDATSASRLRGIVGVADVAPTLMDTVSFEDANLVSVLANGWEHGSLLFRGIHVLDGRVLGPGDDRAVMLGRVLALNLGGKRVGDRISIVGESFLVIGIFESDSLFENGSLIMPLATLQRMMGREGQVTGFVVSAASSDAASLAALSRRIESRIPGVAATPARDYVQGDVQIRLAKAMAWTTTAVALLLGSVGMMNTMMMAVFERTQEIGVLRALGWRRRRVLSLILGEAILLGLLGAAIGAVLALLGARALTLAPTARGFIDPDLPPWALGVGAAMGVGLSLLGGLYPAVRAAALDPTEALRHD